MPHHLQVLSLSAGNYPSFVLAHKSHEALLEQISFPRGNCGSSDFREV